MESEENTRWRWYIITMKKTQFACLAGIAGLVPACFVIGSVLSGTAAALTVTVDSGKTYQTFEGWGTSLCWWAVTAGSWKAENRSALIGAIVDPDTGLGYTCFRYNIGGGDNPSHTHLKGERAVPGFKPTETGNYDWSADQAQRNILLGIAARDPNCIFEAFSNSPPWWMTISGCASGNTDGADNLKATYFTAFADYLATVVRHYRDEWGIPFRTVEPFNEPSSGYWKVNGGQEGCGFKNNQSKMVVELGKKLEEKGLFPDAMVSAADETALDQAVTGIKSYSDSALHYLSQINSHSYGGWGSRKALYDIAVKQKKNLWQSESGPLGKNDNSDIAMWMSDVIIQDLRVLKANAWIDWQVGDPVGDWQTIGLNGTAQTFKYTKRYYMHAAFSRFIRPGSRIISSSDTNSLAAIVPSTGNVVIVLRNSASGPAAYTVDLTKCAPDAATAQMYRFALPGSLTRIDDEKIDNMKFTFSAPGQTITTCVIPRPVAIRQRQSVMQSSAIRMSQRDGRGAVRLVFNKPSPYVFRLFDVGGKLVFERYGCPDRPEVRLAIASAGLSNGLYLAEVRTENAVASGEKIYLFR